MKLLSQKETFLLEAPLEVLHAQSIEWLEEVQFFRDEVAFFYKLILKEAKANPEIFKTADAKKVEKQLIRVAVHELDELQNEVIGHEKFLARLMEEPKLNVRLYYDRHSAMVRKFTQFEKEYMQMKKEIFLLAEKAHRVLLQHSEL